MSINNLQINFFSVLLMTGLLSAAPCLHKIGDDYGERIKKNGFVGVSTDDDFWNLEPDHYDFP